MSSYEIAYTLIYMLQTSDEKLHCTMHIPFTHFPQRGLNLKQWGSGKVKIWPKITPILPLIAPYSDLP